MKKKIAVVIATLAATFTISTGAGFAAELVGLWESTVTMKMEGMPAGMAPMSFKSERCYSKDNAVPMSSNKEDDCKLKDMKKSGSTMSWAFECVSKKGDVTEGKGEMTVSEKKYTGKMTTTMNSKKGRKSTQTMTMEGRKLGDCKKS